MFRLKVTKELTAQWTAPTYAVTLNTGDAGVNSGNVTEYTYGVGATLPTDVTRTGYTFKGWYDNETNGVLVTAIGGTETGNKEYWAKVEQSVPITFDTAGEKLSRPSRRIMQSAITAPADPTREVGYGTFAGWASVLPRPCLGAHNMTITAQWTVNHHHRTFDT